jgi:hypothetical protein
MQTAAVQTSCLVDPGSTTLISLEQVRWIPFSFVELALRREVSADLVCSFLLQCGNGILEPGEDCDPGAGAESACCDPASEFRFIDLLCLPSLINQKI